MADLAESVEDMLIKLDNYREQLALVETALAQESGDHLLKLREDLQEVIMYTEDLVRYKNAAASAAMAEEKAGRPVVKSAHSALIKRTCECFWENKWYNGTITSVRKDERGVERCQVMLIGMSVTREYKISEVRLLKPPPPVQCQVGARIMAIFADDGLWYDATILEQTSAGYRVEFLDYGEKLEVRFDQVRLKNKRSKVETEEEIKKRQIKNVTTPGGFLIPENLIPDANDTDKQKEVKRRKIHALKSEQRKQRVEQEAVIVQNNWLKFKTKASSKSKTGFYTGKTKESIFKSPDSIDGKVGVVGSGQGMTSFEQRTKFTYNQS